MIHTKLRKFGELLLIILLLILTAIIRIIRYGYIKFRNFVAGRHRGIWILLLLILLITILSILASKHTELLNLEAKQNELKNKNTEILNESEQKEKQIKELEEQIQKKDEEIKKLSYVPPKPKYTPKTNTTYNGSLSGKVSHYSRSGCLGCSPNLTMANGETLDDNRLTIAVPPGTIPMNTQVKVINESNGKEVIATVTDTGGFTKYNRIADLTPAVANALGTQTDISQVKIEVLN